MQLGEEEGKEGVGEQVLKNAWRIGRTFPTGSRQNLCWAQPRLPAPDCASWGSGAQRADEEVALGLQGHGAAGPGGASGVPRTRSPAPASHTHRSLAGNTKPRPWGATPLAPRRRPGREPGRAEPAAQPRSSEKRPKRRAERARERASGERLGKRASQAACLPRRGGSGPGTSRTEGAGGGGGGWDPRRAQPFPCKCNFCFPRTDTACGARGLLCGNWRFFFFFFFGPCPIPVPQPR